MVVSRTIPPGVLNRLTHHSTASDKLKTPLHLS
ncbi:hypothetical protein Y023_4841 [Burkholderia pseudomallei A79D]|nr:hypothetical protein Y597_6084 [Burkholderia pseudomallei MSHR1000]KGX97125.1 hypothetical protein Y023_4841 [Burkholderia pseudomallei A79D]KGX98010.1 hypothetical protein X997_4556 [Burkholderia pseudomallei A79C]